MRLVHYTVANLAVAAHTVHSQQQQDTVANCSQPDYNSGYNCCQVPAAYTGVNNALKDPGFECSPPSWTAATASDNSVYYVQSSIQNPGYNAPEPHSGYNFVQIGAVQQYQMVDDEMEPQYYDWVVGIYQDVDTMPGHTYSYSTFATNPGDLTNITVYLVPCPQSQCTTDLSQQSGYPNSTFTTFYHKGASIYNYQPYTAPDKLLATATTSRFFVNIQYAVNNVYLDDQVLSLDYRIHCGQCTGNN